MQEQEQPKKSIAAFTLWSLTGCGLGAVAAGIIGGLLNMLFIAPQLEDPAAGDNILTPALEGDSLD